MAPRVLWRRAKGASRRRRGEGENSVRTRFAVWVRTRVALGCVLLAFPLGRRGVLVARLAGWGVGLYVGVQADAFLLVGGVDGFLLLDDCVSLQRFRQMSRKKRKRRGIHGVECGNTRVQLHARRVAWHNSTRSIDPVLRQLLTRPVLTLGMVMGVVVAIDRLAVKTRSRAERRQREYRSIREREI